MNENYHPRQAMRNETGLSEISLGERLPRTYMLVHRRSCGAEFQEKTIMTIRAIGALLCGAALVLAVQTGAGAAGDAKKNAEAANAAPTTTTTTTTPTPLAKKDMPNLASQAGDAGVEPATKKPTAQ